MLFPFFLGVALQAEEVWRLEELERLAGHSITVVGAPQLTSTPHGQALLFDGARDGVFIPAIPIAGARAFTIEVLFAPARDGLPEQRFLHLQDTKESRCLIELRLDGAGGWWLDTFLRSAGQPRGLALIDPKNVHPTGQWYWVALRYDGKTLSHFVNGTQELEGLVAFAPLLAGQTSIGVRQNKVSWFKGAIRELRFHSEALPPAALQRLPH